MIHSLELDDFNACLTGNTASGTFSGMNTEIPSAGEVCGWLAPMTNSELQQLAGLSGVPFTTLWKIRSGETENPRIETVRSIDAHRGAVVIAAKAV